MFDGMDDIEGVDPYQIKDLQSGMGGMGQAVTPESMAESKAEAQASWAAQDKKTSWVDRITGGVSAIGEAIKVKSQADVAAQADKLRQLAQKGQITQQSYQQMQELLRQRAIQLTQQPQQSFWARNKPWIVLVTLVAVGGVAFYFYKRRK